MNYELAKKLKEAGFPNIKIGEYFEHRVGSHSDDYGGDSDYPCYCNQDKLPTLSELIEACIKLSETGDFHLERSTINSKETFIGWGASIDCFKDDDRFIEGDTPEEAVANLWLALNSK